MTPLEKVLDKHLRHRNKGDLQCRAQLIAAITPLLAGPALDWIEEQLDSDEPFRESREILADARSRFAT